MNFQLRWESERYIYIYIGLLSFETVWRWFFTRCIQRRRMCCNELYSREIDFLFSELYVYFFYRGTSVYESEVYTSSMCLVPFLYFLVSWISFMQASWTTLCIYTPELQIDRHNWFAISGNFKRYLPRGSLTFANNKSNNENRSCFIIQSVILKSNIVSLLMDITLFRTLSLSHYYFVNVQTQCIMYT